MGRLLEEIRDDFIPKNRKRESYGQSAAVDVQPTEPLATNDTAETNSKDGNLSTTSKWA